MSNVDGDVLEAPTIIESAAGQPAPKAGPEAGDGGAESPAPAPGGKPAAAAPAAAGDKTLAQGGEAVKVPVPQSWPDNWRELLAGEDKKALKRLERFTEPGMIWKSFEEADTKIRSGDLVKIPGKRASAEEKQAFFKALGVPEQPAEYMEKIKLSKGRELGDDDRPVIESFASALHPHGATPQQISAAADWWFDYQQAVVEQQEQADAEFRVDSEVTLKQQLGGDFARATNAIGTLFSNAPSEVMDILLNGRTADGHKLGDHPAVVKWLANVALELNPAAGQHVPDGNTMRALEDEISQLAKLSKDDSSEYWNGPNAKKHQARYAELLDIREKMKARAA